jgi:hypothetical protein
MRANLAVLQISLVFAILSGKTFSKVNQTISVPKVVVQGRLTFAGVGAYHRLVELAHGRPLVVFIKTEVLKKLFINILL